MHKTKLIIKPQEEKVQKKLQEIKQWLDRNQTVEAGEGIEYLNSILRGWANYYRKVSSKQTYSDFDARMWWMMWKWAKRRHPKKSGKWIYQKYFKNTTYGVVLYGESTNRRGEKRSLQIYKMNSTRIERHVKVKGRASPDDPKLKEYWKKREEQMGQKRMAKGGKDYQIAQRQRWKCKVCRGALFNGEPLQLHHLKPIREGGGEEVENLEWVHEACHHNTYHGRRKSVGQSARAV